MLKVRVIASAFCLALVIGSVAVSAAQAALPKNCDDEIWRQIKDHSNEGLRTVVGDGTPQHLGIVGSLMLPPVSIAKSPCVRGNLNIWNMEGVPALGTLSQDDTGGLSSTGGGGGLLGAALGAIDPNLGAIANAVGGQGFQSFYDLDVSNFYKGTNTVNTILNFLGLGNSIFSSATGYKEKLICDDSWNATIPQAQSGLSFANYGNNGVLTNQQITAMKPQDFSHDSILDGLFSLFGG